jgi:hypothetical protein
MIKEDGAEKTKQLFVGAMIVSLAVWVAWQWWFGNGLFEGKAFNNGPYGSGATEMFQLVFFLVAQVGALSLGLFRTGISLLKYIGQFLFGSGETSETREMPKLNINIKQLSSKDSSVRKNLEVLGLDGPIFRTQENGVLYRDILLEKELAGPRSSEELAADAVDALMSGDLDRLNERVSQLYPDKVKETKVEVELDEPKSKA